MSTLNGFGTMYYGWSHHADGTASATKWFVLLFLPVFPLARHELRVLTDFARKEPFLRTEPQGFLAGVPAQSTEYQILSVGRLVPREVASTYFWTYAVGSLLVSWPLWLLLAAGPFLRERPELREGNVVLIVSVVLTVLLFANPIAVVMVALRKARGFKGGLLE